MQEYFPAEEEFNPTREKKVKCSWIAMNTLKVIFISSILKIHGNFFYLIYYQLYYCSPLFTCPLKFG